MINPKTIFKMFQVAGVKIRFDLEQKALIIKNDNGDQVHKFDDIEKMVNGAEA